MSHFARKGEQESNLYWSLLLWEAQAKKQRARYQNRHAALSGFGFQGALGTPIPCVGSGAARACAPEERCCAARVCCAPVKHSTFCSHAELHGTNQHPKGSLKKLNVYAPLLGALGPPTPFKPLFPRGRLCRQHVLSAWQLPAEIQQGLGRSSPARTGAQLLPQPKRGPAGAAALTGGGLPVGRSVRGLPVRRGRLRLRVAGVSGLSVRSVALLPVRLLQRRYEFNSRTEATRTRCTDTHGLYTDRGPCVTWSTESNLSQAKATLKDWALLQVSVQICNEATNAAFPCQDRRGSLLRIHDTLLLYVKQSRRAPSSL